MLHKIKIVSVLLFITAGLAIQLGCDTSSSDDSGKNLVALSALTQQKNLYWKSAGWGDGFEIDPSNGMFYQYDDAEKNVSFAGEIVGGYVTVKITATGTWGKTVDKYYVVHLKGATGYGAGDTIQESCAYQDGDLIESGADSQADAETEFTVANGYFGIYGDYVKQ